MMGAPGLNPAVMMQGVGPPMAPGLAGPMPGGAMGVPRPPLATPMMVASGKQRKNT